MKRWFLLAALMLSGCAARMDIARLPLSDWGDAGLANVMHVRIEKGAQTFQFEGFAEIESARTAIVGLTPAGTRGFSLVYARGELEFESIPFYRLPVSDRQLLAVFQMVYWPVERFAGENRRVVETAAGRVFYRHDKEQARVDWPSGGRFTGPAVFRLPAEDLTVTITTRVSESLEEP